MTEQKTSGEEVFTFELVAQEGNARAGVFHTPHGDIETPIFAPVGTKASVKGERLPSWKNKSQPPPREHLSPLPPPRRGSVNKMGGLHKFMNCHIQY